MRYLIDSDWIIDGLKGAPTVLLVLNQLSAEGLAVSTVTLAEVLEGAYREPDPQAMVAGVHQFLEGYRMLPVSADVAAAFARIRSELRRTGMLIPDLDLLIAATAVVHDIEMVTRNRAHFWRVPGIRLLEEPGNP